MVNSDSTGNDPQRASLQTLHGGHSPASSLPGPALRLASHMFMSDAAELKGPVLTPLNHPDLQLRSKCKAFLII